MGLFDIFTNDNAEQAAQQQIQGLTNAYGAAKTAIGQGSNALTSNYTAALQDFLKNYGTANSGVGALSDALGLTGNPAQVEAKLAATPGYQFQLQQGNENILRNQARTGDINSGATNVDLMNYGQGLADQTYQNYVNNLQPFLGYSTANAGGVGNIYTGLGNELNQNYNTLGNLGWTYNTNVGNANANATLANNAASGNIWNAMGSAASTAAQFLPMLSDERAKEDIEPVGELYDGTNVYRYRYKGDDIPRIGVMAQEVEQSRPEAVKEINGWKTVDYGKATDYAAELARFLKAA